MKHGLIAALLCALVLFAALPQAVAHAGARADTDGYVPVAWECHGLDDEGMPEGQHRWAKTTVRAWPSAADPREYRNEVRIDWCKVFDDGGGFYDLYRIYRHEMAHARDGLGHGEGSESTNPAYRAATTLTGL